jgi:hypothetical protein
MVVLKAAYNHRMNCQIGNDSRTRIDVSLLCVVEIELPFLSINSGPVHDAHLKLNSPPACSGSNLPYLFGYPPLVHKVELSLASQRGPG